MGIRKTLQHVSTTGQTPQTEPIPGREAEMVPNNAGGFAFPIDDWTALDRFLILGTEGGTFYVSEKKLTTENVDAVRRCLALDGLRVVRRIVEVSSSGRAPKNDPAIIALALALKTGDEATRDAAAAAIPEVCRIGTHLFHFAEAVEAFGGWGRRTRKAFARWYSAQSPPELAYNVAKYQSRDGWSHRDLLRLSKPSGHARGGDLDRILYWVAKGWPDVGKAPPEQPDPTTILWAFERAKLATTDAEVVALIRAYNLPRECVPSERLNSPEVWSALLGEPGERAMPVNALVRNLGKMGAIGLLSPLSDAARRVCAILGDRERLRRSRLHPLAILIALKTYAAGRGVKGSNTWTPVPQVVDALDAAFYDSFGNVQPTGSRVLVACDWSGSMASPEVAPGISPAVAAVALALVHASIEPQTYVLAFATGAKPVTLSPRMRLDDAVCAAWANTGECTDVSVPFRFALQQGIPVDGFVVLTDNETWAGHEHASQALVRYRQKTGIGAKAIGVAMASNGCTMLDPKDARSMNVAGFDAAVPSLVADFLRR